MSDFTGRELDIMYREAFEAGQEQGRVDMARIVAERDKLREALQGAVRCWETDLAMGHEVDRHYYRQAKAALQEDRDG